MSYPYLSDALKDLSGIDIPLPIPTFGLGVMSAMLIATWVFRIEMQRLRQIGALLSGRDDLGCFYRVRADLERFVE